MDKKTTTQSKSPSLIALIRPYRNFVIPLILLVLLANGLTLWLPRLLARAIDGFAAGGVHQAVLWEFAIAAAIIYVLTYLQSIVQTVASERVAQDLRSELSEKISTQSLVSIQSFSPAKLLTNMTSDVESVKNFVSQAIVIIVSSVFLILGGSYLLIATNWKLGLAVLVILPIIGGAFFFILKKVRVLFGETRKVIDRLNKVINESILGSVLIRVLHSQHLEHEKFAEVNTKSRDIGIDIVKLFAALIPIITFTSGLAVLIILVLGGRFVIDGSMTFGEFASFNSYLTILIFPIIILGFVGNIVAQAQVSYGRISAVLSSPAAKEDGSVDKKIKGDIQIEQASLLFGQKYALKKVTLSIQSGTKAAIIGPTAAGKTQLMNLLIGLAEPTEGSIRYDGVTIQEYKKEALYRQIGLVFQDSVVFNTSLRENIAFNTEVSDLDMQKAIKTAELGDFIDSLPKGLDTVVSERGTSLSGGQKQRIMLARALAINPRVLLLDDFTARVDKQTEAKILENVSREYPGITLVSVTQKISSVEAYDQVIVLMDGEIVATGKHDELLRTSPEYVQIYNSQKSTNTYEL